MKILAIRLLNLASLAGQLEIDFRTEPLRSAGIYAITGPTGAGKSTVLDALCLALFAKTPRYVQARETEVELTDISGSRISQGDPRGILRDGTAEGYAEVDFLATDQQAYRARWSLRRARNQPTGKLQEATMQLRKLDTNSDLGGTKRELLARIEQLLGLNFEQFTRSVLLAQGDFTAFLKADKSEKASVLEKLTGTEIYSRISRTVFQRTREQEHLLVQLRAQLGAIALLSPEQQNAMQQQAQQLQMQLQALQLEQHTVTENLQWHNQWALLSNSFAQSETTVQQTKDALQQAENRLLRLRQIEKAQEARQWTEALTTVAEKQQLLQHELAEAAKAIEALGQLRTQLAFQHEQANTQLEQCRAEVEKAAPILIQARDLDVRLHELQQQLAEKKKLHQTNTAALEEQTDAASQTQKEAEITAQKLQSAQAWLTEHAPKKGIAEHKTLLLARLAEAEKLRQQAAEHQKEQVAQQKTAAQLQAQVHDLEKQLESLSAQNSALALELSQLQLDAAQTNLPALELQMDSLSAQRSGLQAASVAWQVLEERNAEHHSLHQKLAQLTQATEQTAFALQKAEEAVHTLKQQELQARLLHERASLEAATNTQSLRGKLQPQQACPVCGSTEHPYAEGTQALDSFAKKLHQEYQTAREAYSQAQQQQTHLQTTQAQQSQQQQDLQQQQTRREELLRAAQTKWNELANKLHFPLVSALPEIASATSDIPEQIGQAQRKTDEQLQQLAAQKQRARQQAETITQQAQMLLEAEKKQQNTAHQKAQLELKRQAAETLAHRSAEQQQAANKAFELLQQELSAYFADERWLQNWQQNPADFVRKLEQFADAWQHNTRLTHDLALRAQSLQASLEQMKLNTHRLGQALADEAQQNQVLERNLGEMQQHRSALLNGLAADVFEQQQTQRLQLAQQLHAQLAQQLQEHQLTTTRQESQQQQRQQQQAALQVDKQKLEAAILHWLQQQTGAFAPASLPDLLALLQLDSAWRQAERSALDLLHTQQLQAQSVWQERKQALEAHQAQRKSTLSLEQLQARANELSMEQEALHSRRSMLQSQLQTHKKNQAAAERQQRELDRQQASFDNWARLNELIGSADGKKFRQMAQEYTLDVLLVYANLQLEQLSRRYHLLRVPDTLGLQVVDHDMGNELRSVHSLSGGESFLVSLALALGLSGLTSNRLRIESLFIDEGFGSLDPLTLAVAMDALERLQHQGRKVGVISHVQEMTERIAVQIRITKQSSGASHMDIVG